MNNTNLALIGVLLFSSFVQAGGVGNGGMAYVCRKPKNNKITYARMLDLWEPEQYQPLRTNKLSVQSQIDSAISKLKQIDPVQMQELEETVLTMQRSTVWVRKKLFPTPDVLPNYSPEKHCQFEQVAVYGYDADSERPVLRVNQEIFGSSEFSYTDRAALYLHEALYYLDREYNSATHSRPTRRVIGVTFTNDKTYSNFDRLLISNILAGRSYLQYSGIPVGGDETKITFYVRMISELKNGEKPLCAVTAKQDGETREIFSVNSNTPPTGSEFGYFSLPGKFNEAHWSYHKIEVDIANIAKWKPIYFKINCDGYSPIIGGGTEESGSYPYAQSLSPSNISYESETKYLHFLKLDTTKESSLKHVIERGNQSINALRAVN